MLSRDSRRFSVDEAPAARALAQESTIDLLESVRLMRRQAPLIVAVGAVFMIAGLVYLAVTPPHYLATATLLIDPRQSPSFSESPSTNSLIDSAYVDSQVEILKSEKLARAVASQLDLKTDPEFRPPIGGSLSIIPDLFSVNVKPPSEADILERVVAKLKAKLTIKRVGLTYVIEVSCRSLDPRKAAKISNALLQSYLVGQLESKYQASRQVATWVQDRILELKARAQAAEQAAAEFKSSTAGKAGNSAAVNEQQLAELAVKNRTALNDLESSARSQRSLYETFLQRSTETAQQQSFPVSEARVIAEATPPIEKHDPKALLVLGTAAALGLFGGLAAAFAREHLNVVFRLPSQIERDLGIRCLGVLPYLLPGGSSSKVGGGDAKQQGDLPQDQHELAKNGLHTSTSQRQIFRNPLLINLAIDEALPLLNEEMKFIGADIASLGPRGKVVGITSALPQEGKSTVAVMLGESLAEAGRKTLLIDCDLRKAGLTRQLAATAVAGLADLLAGRGMLTDLLWFDRGTKLDLLPAGLLVGLNNQSSGRPGDVLAGHGMVRGLRWSDPKVEPDQLSGAQSRARTNHPVGLLSSSAMQKLLEDARSRYDQIILDLPAIAPAADTKAASHLVDTFILAIEWGQTSGSVVKTALKTAPFVADRLLGAILTKAKLDLPAGIRSSTRRVDEAFGSPLAAPRTSTT